MDPLDVAVVALLVLGYAAVSQPLRRVSLTPPLVFVLAGVALGPAGLGIIQLGVDEPTVRILAEITLALILFSDAARIDLGVLRAEYHLPVRLLAVGMPLAIAVGTGAALLLLPGLGVWEAALLAAVLAPTDAALMQPVVGDRRVPVRVRQALNVESGLNDGLVLPVITVLVAAAGGRSAATGAGGRVVAEQLGYGVGVGLALGYLGARVVDGAATRGWMGRRLEQLATLAVALAALGLTQWLGGSGFVAAFSAGMTFGVVARDRCGPIYDFTEEEGHLLSLITFLVFGVALVGPALGEVGGRPLLYAVASLTLVRIPAIWGALVGTGLHHDTVAYLGWFGPRGLASLVFALVVVEESGLPAAGPILDVTVVTVLFSVVAHGLTAGPAAAGYARRVELRRQRRGEGPEHAPATELHVRP